MYYCLNRVNFQITELSFSVFFVWKKVFVFLCFWWLFFNAEVDGDVYLSIAHQLYKAGNYQQALEHCKAIYEKNPRRTDVLLLIGAIYFQVFQQLQFIYIYIYMYIMFTYFDWDSFGVWSARVYVKLLFKILLWCILHVRMFLFDWPMWTEY